MQVHSIGEHREGFWTQLRQMHCLAGAEEGNKPLHHVHFDIAQ